MPDQVVNKSSHQVHIVVDGNNKLVGVFKTDNVSTSIELMQRGLDEQFVIDDYKPMVLKEI